MYTLMAVIFIASVLNENVTYKLRKNSRINNFKDSKIFILIHVLIFKF